MNSADEVKIGDFSQPVTAAIKTVGPSPTKEKLDVADRQLDEEMRKDEAVLKPMASYEERLKEAGIDKNKAAEIIDAVLFKGFYAEDIKITSRVKARLRTRNSRDTKRAQELLEQQRLTLDTHYNESLTRILLAASLERFGDDTLEFPSRKASVSDVEKAFHDRLAYVDSMADPAMRIMFAKLSKFDRMVSIALEEGSIENF